MGIILNIYNLRKNITAFYSDNKEHIRGKLAFKTKELHWLETPHPVVILISVHSAFHEEIKGDLKMSALISTIREHVRGGVTVLFSDVAHLQTVSLAYGGDRQLAFHECLRNAAELHSRYRPYIEDCKIAYWHSYICQDPHFEISLKFINNLYQTDLAFRSLLDRDVEESYASGFNNTCSNKILYLEKAKMDLLVQCASLFVLAKKGYRYQFYTGCPVPSVEYVECTYIPEEKSVSWINVFLTIEKKTTLLLHT